MDRQRVPGDRRAARHARTRDEILLAAWEVAALEGIAGLSLRAVAERVGMRTPSLYSYVDSKHALYDAMFAQGNQALLDHVRAIEWPDDERERVRIGMRAFVEFSVADPARYQLLFQRTIPGFEPSPGSWELARAAFLVGIVEPLREIGLDDPDLVDLATAIGSGLAAQQLANDPGGTRWLALVDQAADMFYDHAIATRRTR